MSEKISSAENALDSLRRAAHELEKSPTDHPLTLKGVLCWGWHAVALLAYLRLQPGRQAFDFWMQDYLQEGSPTVEADRDARWEERQRLSLLELLDILSESSLSSLKPEFYQGWQDRMSRCRWVRQQTYRLIGGCIDAAWRESLLFLLAAYHRLIRLPAAVEIDYARLLKEIPALLNLCELLIEKNSPPAAELLQTIERCRKAYRERAGK